MSSQLDPNIASVLKESGLGPEACWKHKQSGKWIVYHWACETIAAKRGIVFDLPQVVVADPSNKIATILVKGTLGKQTEWSFGEAAPYNTQQTYPFSMAEKRGKDRVILKLIGLHGLAYSEEEADDFKPAGPGRDITHGVGSAPAEPQAMDLFNPYGEVEGTFSSPKEYLDALAVKLEARGSWWPPNKHVVEWIGKTYDKDAVLKKHARQVYKYGVDAWRNAPENTNGKGTPTHV